MQRFATLWASLLWLGLGRFVSTSVCDYYVGVGQVPTEWCQTSLCKEQCAKDTKNCMALRSNYCKYSPLRCVSYAAPPNGDDQFCRETACSYCTSDANPEACMQHNYLNSNVCIELKPFDCQSLQSSNPDYDTFCKTTACDFCRKTADPTACIQTNYATICRNIEYEDSLLPAVNLQITEVKLPPSPEVPFQNVVVGSYFPNWFVYKKIYMGSSNIVSASTQKKGKLDQALTYWPAQMKNLAPKLTHVFYGFMDLNKQCYVEDSDPDASWYGAKVKPTWITIPAESCGGVLNDMMQLKTMFPHLKLMLSLGGWTYSSHFSTCAKSPETRKKIYDSFKFYVSSMDPNWGSSGIWSGIDFDWEHPGTPANHTNFDRENDWDNYVKLLEDFRTLSKADGHELVLSSAIGMGETLDILVSRPATAAAFCSKLDFVNMMTYDLHGKWDKRTGHNAQFCEIDGHRSSSAPDPKLRWSVKGSVEKLGNVCPLSKLNLGIPNYSPAWSGIPNKADGLYQVSEFTDANDWVRWSSFSESDTVMEAQGIISYWDLKKTVQSDKGFKIFGKDCPADRSISVPVKWVYNAEKQLFACLEDPETAKAKAQWARRIGMGGFFFWDAQQDKEGDILSAAYQGWGLPEKGISPVGGKTCFDDRKPDFTKRGDGANLSISSCQQKGHILSIKPGVNCPKLRKIAEQTCGTKTPIPVGGDRQNACKVICTPTWYDAVMAWTGDKVYYICEGDSL